MKKIKAYRIEYSTWPKNDKTLVSIGNNIFVYDNEETTMQESLDEVERDVNASGREIDFHSVIVVDALRL